MILQGVKLTKFYHILNQHNIVKGISREKNDTRLQLIPMLRKTDSDFFFFCIKGKKSFQFLETSLPQLGKKVIHF